MSMSDEIEKLHRLHVQGALTDEEFTLAKKRLIDGIESRAEPTKPRTEPQAEPRRNNALNEFKLSNQDRWIAGVCGGLADLTQIPAWSWRILFVLTGLLHGLGVLMYILLWIFVPRRSLAVAAPVAPQSAASTLSGSDKPQPPTGEA